MAAPQGGYPPQGGDPYAQGFDQQFDANQQPPGYAPAGPPEPPSTTQPVSGAGGRKKRVYAGQAFDYGIGANAAGPQPPLINHAGGPGPGYGGYPQQPQMSGFQPMGQGLESAGSPPPYLQQQQASPPYGNVGGYQSPDPSHSAQPSSQMAGMAGFTNQFSQMNVGGQQTPQRAQPLNQLFPTDLVNQPFHVSELDLAPPPIILPVGVC